MKGYINISQYQPDDGLVHIDVIDDISGVHFLELSIDKADFVGAIGGHGHIPIDFNLSNANNVGKVRQRENFKFCMGEIEYSNQTEKATLLAEELCPEGWHVSTNFCSKGSFSYDDGNMYANTYIYRYIDPE